MAPAGISAVDRVPRGWKPQAVLAAHYPAITELCRTVLPEIRRLEKQLDCDEAAGRDTVCQRQAIGELLWRLQYTGDAEAAAKTLERVRALARSAPAAVATCDEHGSFGIGTDVWFLKLDASVDPMLADDFDARGIHPRFLDAVNHPDSLRKYLDRPRRLEPRHRRRRSPQRA